MQDSLITFNTGLVDLSRQKQEGVGWGFCLEGYEKVIKCNVSVITWLSIVV